jgi:hypothetical protein
MRSPSWSTRPTMCTSLVLILNICVQLHAALYDAGHKARWMLV